MVSSFRKKMKSLILTAVSCCSSTSIQNGGFDLYPDPMLLLIKAAVNWSWWCGQKLLPACGCANEEEEELVASSTPVPATIEFKTVPVTPDDDDDVSV